MRLTRSFTGSFDVVDRFSRKTCPRIKWKNVLWNNELIRIADRPIYYPKYVSARPVGGGGGGSSGSNEPPLDPKHR